MSPAFYATYFGTLVVKVWATLHGSVRPSEWQKSLQFSFATILLHMSNQHSPIYDSQVAAFYFFQERDVKDPKDPQDLQRRISALGTFHDFLRQEYSRVLQNNLLASAIQEFVSD